MQKVGFGRIFYRFFNQRAWQNYARLSDVTVEVYLVVDGYNGNNQKRMLQNSVSSQSDLCLVCFNNVEAGKTQLLQIKLFGSFLFCVTIENLTHQTIISISQRKQLLK
ncbi:unnamed protein product [Clavelina lepadiformis]|uniref:Uncharacterized protein n=1 Tax=Clavelina lepadiformis TaxID=159417 RepID=A0ABP0GY35_CLALP